MNIHIYIQLYHIHINRHNYISYTFQYIIYISLASSTPRKINKAFGYGGTNNFVDYIKLRNMDKQNGIQMSGVSGTNVPPNRRYSSEFVEMQLR